MTGQKIYAPLSSLAKQFLKSEQTMAKPIINKKYEYIGAGTNLPSVKTVNDSKIHEYLSPYDISEHVSKEFGKNIDIIA